jgi:hypothetical protein
LGCNLEAQVGVRLSDSALVGKQYANTCEAIPQRPEILILGSTSMTYAHVT